MSILFFIVFNFYILATAINIELFFYVTLLLAVLTDGLFIFVHLFRKSTKHTKNSFDPSKVTAVIACYNGEDVIEETIRQARVHLPAKQIIVVSDASTDKTEALALKMGVKVFRNKRNVNKAFSISAVMKHVKTPYVLIIDDDTHIAKALIPTSLLDDGYDAVAFNVMPMDEDNMLVRLQIFEYRKSMQIGKNLRSNVGAIGNVSGAIGLFRTKDLVQQRNLHSGQFGGEDEQRTLLVHLHSKGRGIAYTDSTVLTKAPATSKALFKQRAFSWNLSTPELFWMYWQVILDGNYHFLLKAEKAYSIYTYVTDPLRILFFWVLFMRPAHIFIAYGFYLILSLIIWLKTKRQDKLYVAALFPIYSFAISICRFIGHFYWYKVKFEYFIKRRHHKLVPGRKLRLELALLIVVNVIIWTTAIAHFNSDLSLLHKINSHRLDEFNTDVLSYESIDMAPASSATNQANQNTVVVVSLAHSESKNSLAHKILEKYAVEHPEIIINDDARQLIESRIAAKLPDLARVLGKPSYQFPTQIIRETLIVKGATQ